MLVQSHRRMLFLVALLAVMALPGCQSCQGSKQAPPPRETQPQDAAQAVEDLHEHDGVDEPAIDEPIEDEDEGIDEDALVLLAEGDSEDGEAPLTVRFSVESLLEDEMNGPQYKWDFGDGSPISTDASPTHVYEKPGSYTATIRIVDAAGQLGWDEVDIEVDEP